VVALDEGEVRVLRIFHTVRVGLRKRRPPAGGHPPGGGVAGAQQVAPTQQVAAAQRMRKPVENQALTRTPVGDEGGLSAGRSKGARVNIMGIIRTTPRNPLRIKHLRRARACASVLERVLIARP